MLVLGLLLLAGGAVTVLFLVGRERRPPLDESDRFGQAESSRRHPDEGREAADEPRDEEDHVASEPLATVDVHVVSSSGKPAGGATVRIAQRQSTPDPVPPPVEGETGPDGFWRAEVPASWGSDLSVSAVGPAGTEATPKARVTMPGASVTLRLVASVTVEGRVVGLEGDEWRGTVVNAFSATWGGTRELSVGKDGSFRVEGVMRYLGLSAFAPGRTPSRYLEMNRSPSSNPEVVRLPDAPGTVRVELDIGPRSVPARLRVIDDSGEPLPPGTRILVRSGAPFEHADTPHVVTDPDGWIDMEGLAPGKGVHLHVWSSRRSDGEYDLVTAEADLPPAPWDGPRTVIFPRSAHAVLRVVGEDEKPLPDFRVFVRRVSPGNAGEADGAGVHRASLYSSPSSFTSDEQGRIRVERHPAGTYEVAETRNGKALWTGDLAPVDVGGTVPQHVVPVLATRVRVTLVPHEGERKEEWRSIRATNVSAGIVPKSTEGVPSEFYDRFVRFDPSPSVVLHADHSMTDACVRVVFKEVGWRDYPVPSDGELVVTPPAGSATVRVAIRDPVTPVEGTVGLLGELRPRYEFRLSTWLSKESGVVWFVGVPPATYRWTASANSLSSDITGTVQLGPGLNQDVIVDD